MSVTVYGLGAPPDPADLVMYGEAGVERCVYHLPSVGRDEFGRLVEEIGRDRPGATVA